MLRVCHLASGLLEWGGIARMLLDFFSQPHSDHFRHYLITTSSSDEFAHWVKTQQIGWFQSNRGKYNPARLWDIPTYLTDKDIQVLHSYNAHGNAWALSASIAMKRPPRLVASEHGAGWFIQPPLRWFDRWAKQRARLVIVNSRAAAMLLQQAYALPASKIRLVYNGVRAPQRLPTVEARQRLGLPLDAEVVGSIGRLDTPKDYWTLIDAARLVIPRRKNVHFVIIGEGPQEAFLKRQAQQAGIADRFHWAGSRDDARDLISGFDLFVSTSFREAFGNVLVEAALQEKAVIATAVDGIPEAVQDGVSGVLLAPTMPVRPIRAKRASPMPAQVVREGRLQPPRSLDPHLLAETIIELLDDPEKRAWMGMQSRQRAERLFNIQRYVADLEQVYLETAV